MTDNPSLVTALTPEPESIEAPKEVLEALDRLEGALKKMQDEVQLNGKMLTPTPKMRQALQEAVQTLRGLEPFFSGFDDRTQHLPMEDADARERFQLMALLISGFALLFEIVLDHEPAEPS